MATKESVLAGLEPRSFWAHFETLTTIARPSRHEEPAIEHVRAWADRHGFELAAGRRPEPRRPRAGDPGREDAPTVALQGHLDMVCERDPASPNDPAEGRIALIRDGDWLTADGTTLGADDGVAIAAMMALVEDESLPHGPLELLMTVAEEVGLEGANGLDPALVTGSILINLDSEEDGQLTVGCAGSTDTWIRIEAPREPAADGARDPCRQRHRRARRPLRHEDRAGPVERDQGARARAARGRRPCPSGSSRSDGGKSRNAIPRDAIAVCSVASDGEQAFRAAVAAAGGRRFATRTRRRTPASPVEVAAAEPGGRLDRRGHRRGARLPSRSCRPGRSRMSPDFDDLVETSTSLGEAIDGGRSADAAQPLALVERLGAARCDRDARRRRTAGRRRARGQAQLRRLATGPRLAAPSPSAKTRVRAPLRRAADRDRGARRARDRGHRHQGARRPRHALVRPADRVSALARRAG